MNIITQCPVCSKNHIVPKYGHPMPAVFDSDPIKRAQTYVFFALTFSKDCGKALAGDAFEEFEHNKDTNVVLAKFHNMEFYVVTTNGYDGNKAMKISEIRELVMNKFKEIIESW